MSVLNTLPAPVVQMGLVEKIVEMEQNHPQVQQLVSQETAAQELKKQSTQVPKIENSEPGKKIRDREAGQQGKKQHASGKKGHAAEEDPSAEENAAPETMPHEANPWAGHIVNVKI